MNPLPNQIEQQRLSSLFDNAVKHAREVNARAVQVSVDIGREKTQYFEKIALACAGTIALVVSFVGSHAGRLQPTWLLRSALVALLLGMVAAFYRNWKFPFYVLAQARRNDETAKQERERCRRNYIVAVPSVALEDGNPIDVEAFQRQSDADQKVFEKNIKKCQTQEDSAFNIVKRVECAALTLTVVGMGLLVALAWENF
ncbi:MAG: hypothetical protein WCA13_16010 [Terriglobales bacterium]